MVGGLPEPEQPTHTVSLLYYLGRLGVICCILGHLPVLGEPTFQLTGYNTKNDSQEPFQIMSSQGDSSLNPMLSPRTLLPAAPWGGLFWKLHAVMMGRVGVEGWGTLQPRLCGEWKE